MDTSSVSRAPAIPGRVVATKRTPETDPWSVERGRRGAASENHRHPKLPQQPVKPGAGDGWMWEGRRMAQLGRELGGAMPSGVVTLLFTDIEGSTKLIRTLPQ